MLSAICDKLKALESHSGLKRYAANTSWMLGEKVLRMFMGLFVGIWVARYLGPEQFGLLSYAQSFVFLFTAIATLGLDGIVVRELVKDESRRDELLGTAFTLKLTGAILILPILFIAVYFTDNDQYTNMLVFVIASATMFQSFNVIDFYYQSQVLSKYIAIANSLALALSSVVKVVLILNDASLTAFALMTLFDAVVLALGMIYFYKKSTRLSLLNWFFSWGVAKKLLVNSWPLILSGLMISVYMKIDQVMIKEILNNDAVGQYAAAVRLSEVWYFIPMVIVSSVFPAILNARKTDRNLYLSRLQQLYTLMVWMAIAIALPMTFLSEWIVTLLYGEQYSAAGSVLMVHIWASVFVFLGVSFSKYLLAENLILKSFYRSLLGLVVNVILNFILIPKYGVVGAAIATLLGQFAANLLYDFFDKALWPQLLLKIKAFFPIHLRL